jgi:cyclophilin family peptidyl-prolyl cis-trans isomerase
VVVRGIVRGMKHRRVMAQAEIVVPAQHGHPAPIEHRVGRVEVVEPGWCSQSVAQAQRIEFGRHPGRHGSLCISHLSRPARGVARETFLALALALANVACKPAAETAPAATRAHIPSTDRQLQVVDVPQAAVALPPSDRWTRAFSNTPLEPNALRVLLDDATARSDDSAALTLGRRVPIESLGAALGSLPAPRLDAFLRGMTARRVGALNLPPAWRIRWTQDPPSVALATLLGKNAVALDAELAARSEALLIDGDLEHQVAGARTLQNRSVPLPALTSLLALHPVVLPLALRALSLRGATPIALWQQLIPALAARVQTNPRSWSGAWLSLMDAVPTSDAGVRQSILVVEPVVTQIDLHPLGVQAAYRCAVAIRLDHLDMGQRAEACASGPEGWRSLAAIAERARPPMPPGLASEQLRAVLSRGNADARVTEEVARAAVLLPPGASIPILGQLAENRDPGVLAALLEALHEHPAHARAMPSATLDQLLQAPFTLPEVASLEARIHAIELRRTLGRPAIPTNSAVRAVQQAENPDAGIDLQPVLAVPPAARRIWIVETTAGTIRIALRSDTAPEALRQLQSTTEAGAYRHTTFHRIVPGFVAQGGDPRGDGYGGTSRITPTEVSGAPFRRGAVGIALAGPDTGGMQFFITLTDSPHLDARYPYVGTVISGQNVADRLMPGDEIVNASIVSDDPSEP